MDQAVEQTERASLLSGRALWPERATLAAIVLLAAALRLWALDFGFPERVRPDEQYFVNAVRRFDRYGTLDPGWYFYPSFYMYVNAAVWRAWTFYRFLRGDWEVPDARRRQPYTHGLDRLRERWPDMEFFLGRLVTACFGIATVLVLYALTKRFYGQRAAVGAAVLLAVNSLHTLNSHFYKSDVATTFFTLLALWCMACYLAERRLPWNIGAAVSTGLATATNYYGGFLLVPLVASQFIAHGLRFECELGAGGQKGRSSAGGRILDAGRGFARAIGALGRWETYAMPALAATAFIAASPYCFIRWPEFLNVFHRMVFTDRQSLYETMVRQVSFNDYGFQSAPWLYALRFCHRYSLGLLLGVVSVAGLPWLVARRRAVGSVLLLFFVLHFVATCSGKAVFMRYYLSLVPILAMSAAVHLAWVSEKAVPGRASKQAVLFGLLLAVCGAGGFWASLQQDRLLGREDTRVEARRWLAKNIPRGAPVGVPKDWWGDFYPYGKPTLPPGSRYVPVRPAEVRARGLRYVLVDDSPLRLYSPPKRPEWTAWLKDNATLLCDISPYDCESDEVEAVYDQLDAFYVPVARFSSVKRPGPRIRIYKVICRR